MFPLFLSSFLQPLFNYSSVGFLLSPYFLFSSFLYPVYIYIPKASPLLVPSLPLLHILLPIQDLILLSFPPTNPLFSIRFYFGKSGTLSLGRPILQKKKPQTTENPLFKMQFSTLLLAAFAAVTQGTYTCYSYLSDAVLEPVLTHPLAVDVQVVSVGQNPMAGMAGQPALKYYPDNIKAAPGSMVQFQFWAGNHTVTQSDFDHPCTPIHQVNSSIAGIWSSYMPVAAGASKKEIPVFTVMINDTKPIWIYCSQGKHCSAGMSMVINEK